MPNKASFVISRYVPNYKEWKSMEVRLLNMEKCFKDFPYSVETIEYMNENMARIDLRNTETEISSEDMTKFRRRDNLLLNFRLELLASPCATKRKVVDQLPTQPQRLLRHPQHYNRPHLKEQ